MAAIKDVAPCKRALTPFTFNRGLQQANNISLAIHDKRTTAVDLQAAPFMIGPTGLIIAAR